MKKYVTPLKVFLAGLKVLPKNYWNSYGQYQLPN
jgi:hypothetical protein